MQKVELVGEKKGSKRTEDSPHCSIQMKEVEIVRLGRVLCKLSNEPLQMLAWSSLLPVPIQHLGSRPVHTGEETEALSVGCCPKAPPQRLPESV